MAAGDVELAERYIEELAAGKGVEATGDGGGPKGQGIGDRGIRTRGIRTQGLRTQGIREFQFLVPRFPES